MLYRVIANIITASNISIGFIVIISSFNNNLILASWLVLICVVLDIIDGKVSRLSEDLNSFGKEFDSLADLVSFVVAPSVLIFTLNRPQFFLWRMLVCLVAVFCGAFRLARFNTEAEEKISRFFNGLPSPAFGAITVAIVLVHYKYHLIQ